MLAVAQLVRAPRCGRGCRGFESPRSAHVMSRDIPDTRTLKVRVFRVFGGGVLRWANSSYCCLQPRPQTCPNPSPASSTSCVVSRAQRRKEHTVRRDERQLHVGVGSRRVEWGFVGRHGVGRTDVERTGLERSGTEQDGPGRSSAAWSGLAWCCVGRLGARACNGHREIHGSRQSARLSQRTSLIATTTSPARLGFERRMRLKPQLLINLD